MAPAHRTPSTYLNIGGQTTRLLTSDIASCPPEGSSAYSRNLCVSWRHRGPIASELVVGSPRWCSSGGASPRSALRDPRRRRRTESAGLLRHRRPPTPTHVTSGTARPPWVPCGRCTMRAKCRPPRTLMSSRVDTCLCLLYGAGSAGTWLPSRRVQRPVHHPVVRGREQQVPVVPLALVLGTRQPCLLLLTCTHLGSSRALPRPTAHNN